MTDKDWPTTVVLGIDPGTNLLGYALIAVSGRLITPVEMGVVNLRSTKDPYEKMGRILEEITGIMNRHPAREMAIEAPFYGKNVQSMLKLGRAQGVVMAAALQKGLKVYEYAPRKVKMAITGHGAASKEQVALMLRQMLHLQALPESLDATDALAVAVCHVCQSRIPGTQPGHGSALRKSGSRKATTSWKEYLASHPDRLKKD